MRRAVDEMGFTLIEMLVALLMTTVLLAAIVSLFTSFIDDNRYDTFRDDSQNDAQVVIDRMSRELRGAKALSTGTATLQKASAYDIVFAGVSASGSAPSGNATNEIWVRYCLDGSYNLWRQSTTPSSTTSTVPDTTACPSTSNSWIQSGSSPCCKELSDVTDESDPSDLHSLFTYGPSGYSSTSQIKSVEVTLYTDRNPGHLPGPAVLTSAVYLRNALAAPTASFTVSQTVVSSTATTVTLNGTGSADPNGQVLSYQWYNAASCPSANAISGATSQTYSNSYNPSNTPSQAFSLQVTDSAGLTNCTSQTVTIQ